MARADILLSIVKSAISNDNLSLRKAVEALVADERSKNHRILADRLSEILSIQTNQKNKTTPFIQNGAKDLVFEIIPEKRFTDLVLCRMCWRYAENWSRNITGPICSAHTAWNRAIESYLLAHRVTGRRHWLRQSHPN